MDMSAMLKSAYSWPSTSRRCDPPADSMNSGGWSYDVRSQLIGTPLGITTCPEAHSAPLRGRIATKAASSRSLSTATRTGSTPDPPTPRSVEHRHAGRRSPSPSPPIGQTGGMSDLVELAHKTLALNRFMVLGTVDPSGRPRVSPVWFSLVDHQDVYWLSSPDTHHSR